MFKKGLITLVCLTVMSALWSWAATTYSISTKINSLGSTATVVDGKTVYTPIIGGSIQVRDFAAHNTGIKYTNLTTSALVDVVVTPAAGYKVSALTKNGVSQGLAANQTAPVTVQVQKPSPIATQFVVATFAVAGDTAVVSKTWQLQLMNNNGGGKINYTRATVSTDYTSVGKLLAKNYIDTTPVVVTVTPNAGYNIDYLVVNGVKTFYGTDVAQVVNVDPSVGRIKSIVAGYKKKAITVTTANITNGGGIAPLNPVADPYGKVRLIITPQGTQNVVQSVTATGGVLSLTDRFGDPVTLPYVGAVKATISGITSAITVSATYGFDAANSGQYSGCTQTCHKLTSTPQSVRDADTQWLASSHRTQNVDCVSCHQVMPGPDFSTAAAKDALCASCHIAGATPNVGHTAAQNACSTCHTFSGGHNPVKAPVAGTIAADHTGGTVLVRAQYVAQNVTCSNCHAGSNAAIIGEYKESGHADITAKPWSTYDWASASRATCQRCHTTTGYQNSLPGATPVAMAAGQAGQVLTCAGCHSDTATGALRAPGAFTLTTGTNAATVAFADEGASNLCIRCHAGRETGDSIVADPSATGVRGFINSHYLTAAGTVYNKGGYEFAGQSYDNLGYHKNVGKGNVAGTGANGACVACHMSSGEGHTWEFLSHDVNGVITANNSTACVKCHEALTATDLQATKTAFDTSLATLKTALEAKGIYFYEAHPYFYTAPYQAYTAPAVNPNVGFTNWAGVYGLASWKDVMGAAYNYNLLKHEPGAYAHNRQYALKLIADSIDFLNDGVIDGDSGVTVAPSVETGHSVNLVAHTSAGSVAAATNDANLTTSACAACHNDITPAQLAKTPFNDDIAARFVTSRHANQSARNAFCSACHSHEGFVQQVALGKTETYGQLYTAYTAETTNGVYNLPVAGSTFAGVTKKNCATCHDPASSRADKLRGAGDTVVTGLLPGNGSTLAVDTTRTTFSAEFNLCTACHQVKLDATFVPADGYGARGMFKYELASTYSAANLLDAPGGTYKANWLNDLPYHAESSSSRKYIDTHFKGNIMKSLVTGVQADNFDLALDGYNVNPGSADACTICHDPHTGAKLLSVKSGELDDNNNDVISYATGLGNFHTNYEADPFSRVQTGCTPCHTGKDFPRLTTGETVATLGTPGWSVVGCNSCHNLAQANVTAGTNNSAAFATVRTFPTSYQFKFAATAAAVVPAADLGDNAVCFECHKGRIAGANVDAMADPVAGTTNYAISYLHYAPSAAILFGDDSKMVASYSGKSYSGRFTHPVDVNGKTKFNCTDCHNVHTGANVMETATCNGCHNGTIAPTAATLKADVRAYSERLLASVYDDMAAAYALKATDNARFLQYQDGTTQLATMPAGVKGLRSMLIYTFETLPLSYSGAELRTQQDDVLMTYIEERQVSFPNKLVAQAAVAWKVFTYEDGAEDGQAHGHGGSWAHNGKYAKQVMFDAIESLGGDTTGLTRPTL